MELPGRGSNRVSDPPDLASSPSHANTMSAVIPMSPDSARSSTVIISIFPGGVRAAELRGHGDVSQLLPGETEYLPRGVPKRIQEFVDGRLCARRALMDLGIENFPLKVAEDRQPIWPRSIVGSITHTAGFCAAVVAERGRFIGLGLDAEIVGRVGEELWPSICVPAEIDWLRSRAEADREAAAALVFAAKEAFYKCQYPVVQEWLEFHDVRVEPMAWGSPQGLFAIIPVRRIKLANHAVSPLTGRYRFAEEFVFAGVAVPAGV